MISQAELLRWGRQRLSHAGVGTHEAKALLEWAIGVDSLLKAAPNVGSRAAEKYRSAIAQRCHRFPLQHITGMMNFRSLVLHAGPGVFCVRPETELLVDFVSEILRTGEFGSDRPIRVADLCSGSGAIALSVAAENSGIMVDAVELSSTAARYAQRNLARCESQFDNSEVRIVIDDATRALAGHEQSYQVVVSNPPYVPGQPLSQVEVNFDPEMALYGGGEDGLVIPRGIITRTWALLQPGGWMFMEHAEQQAESLVEFATLTGFIGVHTRFDLAGRPRFLVAQSPVDQQAVESIVFPSPTVEQ